jgi:hypothetical protein
MLGDAADSRKVGERKMLGLPASVEEKGWFWV